MTQGIKVSDLSTTASFTDNASILVLTDAANNKVNLLSKGNLVQAIVNPAADNGLEIENNQLKVAYIGSLSNLSTLNKSGIVAAINEVNGNALPSVNILESSGTINLSDNSINAITLSDNVTFVLPAVSDNTKFHQILIQINMPTVYSVDLGLGATPNYFDNTAPDLSISGVYNLLYEYDHENEYWVCGVITKGEAE